MQKSSLKDTLVHAYQDAEHTVEEVLYDKWHIRLHKKVKHHVHKLRKHPDHHKDIISFTVATLVTLVVFIGWYFISFPHIIQTYETAKKQNEALHSNVNPFDEIKNRLEASAGTSAGMAADTNTVAAPENSQDNIQTQ